MKRFKLRIQPFSHTGAPGTVPHLPPGSLWLFSRSITDCLPIKSWFAMGDVTCFREGVAWVRDFMCCRNTIANLIHTLLFLECNTLCSDTEHGRDDHFALRSSFRDRAVLNSMRLFRILHAMMDLSFRSIPVRLVATVAILRNVFSQHGPGAIFRKQSECLPEDWSNQGFCQDASEFPDRHIKDLCLVLL